MTQPIQDFKNPKEIFEAFTQGIAGKNLKDFTANQGQEMLKEFTKAWEALYTQSLQNPQQWVQIMTQYQQEQMRLWFKMLGMSGNDNKPVVSPPPGDRRFAAKEWDENPVFDYVKQSYLLASNLLTQVATNAHLDEGNQKKLEFYTKYFVDAMSPTNFAATNPEVMRQAMETKGQSLIDGLKNMLADTQKGHISMTDEAKFELGKNLAITPGSVVFENDILQLIQYNATTETVSDRPVIVIPPCINKFYILDLQPDNSFVKFVTDQGNTTFIISWRNPDKDQSELMWDDYIEGVLKAFEVAKDITGAKKLNAVAWCVGGTILASTLAVMHVKKTQGLIASATFLTTLLDFSEPGEIGIFVDEAQVIRREMQLQQTGVLPGQELATVFSMLRANDLIWSYVVNNYLKGQTPPPFDILYWNSDPTNLPAKMYSYYLRNMYMENKLIEPNALTICGMPVNLSAIKTPCYFLSTIDDHIAPWIGSYKGVESLTAPIEFVLGASGHIAGVINPASKNKRNYWINGERGKGAARWLETAESMPGTWWNHWNEWLKKKSSNQVPAPQTTGNANYPVIEPAPGRYVKKRV